MNEKELLSINKYTKVLVPATSYDFRSDSRILIPFTCGEKVGFVNQEGVVVVNPKYIMCYGECYSETDYIKVAVIYTYGFPRSGGRVAAYQRPLYGLIDYKGEEIIKPEYFRLLSSLLGNSVLYTVEDKDKRFAALSTNGDEIVPFGKYSWIDGFDHGLARVMNKKFDGQKYKGMKWGIINEKGDEVVPVEHGSIRNFYGKNLTGTWVGNEYVKFDSLVTETEDCENSEDWVDDSDDYEPFYDEYAGTYAQDIEGYSDDEIDNAFDGDPEAYWNID